MLSLCKKKIAESNRMLSLCNLQLGTLKDDTELEHIIDQCKLDIVYFEQLIVGMRKFRRFVLQNSIAQTPPVSHCGSEGINKSKLESWCKGSEFEKWLVDFRESVWNVYNYKERRNIMKAKVVYFLGVPIPSKMLNAISFKHYMLHEFMHTVVCTLQTILKGSKGPKRTKRSKRSKKSKRSKDSNELVALREVREQNSVSNVLMQEKELDTQKEKSKCRKL